MQRPCTNARCRWGCRAGRSTSLRAPNVVHRKAADLSRAGRPDRARAQVAPSGPGPPRGSNNSTSWTPAAPSRPRVRRVVKEMNPRSRSVRGGGCQSPLIRDRVHSHHGQGLAVGTETRLLAVAHEDPIDAPSSRPSVPVRRFVLVTAADRGMPIPTARSPTASSPPINSSFFSAFALVCGARRPLSFD